jgi:putative transposase
MRMQEKFTGCRVLSYCVMGNHFHLLMEIPPMELAAFSDSELLKRLSALYNEAFVAGVAQELADARTAIYPTETGLTEALTAIHKRFTYRMHELGEFMKGLLQRFTQWFNRTHLRTGRLWEDRFKSVIVEDGVAARTISAYIDLNPVRAGMVKDPAIYRWSSYGEALGGGPKGNGKTARSGLVRAFLCGETIADEAGMWKKVGVQYRRLMGMAMNGGNGKLVTLNTAELLEKGDTETVFKDLKLASLLRGRVRYFTDGAVIGSKEFVNDAFSHARHRFGPNRKTGARTMKGNAHCAKGVLWSVRDLRKGIS